MVVVVVSAVSNPHIHPFKMDGKIQPQKRNVPKTQSTLSLYTHTQTNTLIIIILTNYVVNALMKTHHNTISNCIRGKLNVN